MRTPAEDVGHHAAAGTLLDPPKPAGALLGAHVRPPFVRMQDPVRRPGDRCYEGGVDGGGGQGSDFFFRCASTVLVEMRSTRAVSRMPLPLRASATICGCHGGAAAR